MEVEDLYEIRERNWREETTYKIDKELRERLRERLREQQIGEHFFDYTRNLEDFVVQYLGMVWRAEEALDDFMFCIYSE